MPTSPNTDGLAATKNGVDQDAKGQTDASENRTDGDVKPESAKTGTKDCSKLKERVRTWWQHRSKESADSLWVGHELLILELDGAHGEISATLNSFSKRDGTFPRATAYRNRDRYLLWLTWRHAKTAILTVDNLKNARDLVVEPTDTSDHDCIAANPTVRSLMSFLRKELKLDLPGSEKTSDEASGGSDIPETPTAEWCMQVVRKVASWAKTQTKLPPPFWAEWQACNAVVRICAKSQPRPKKPVEASDGTDLPLSAEISPKANSDLAGIAQTTDDAPAEKAKA